MWVDHVHELSELFRYTLPYYLILLLPIFIILSPAEAAHDFPVYRLQHFDLQGVKYGNDFDLVFSLLRLVVTQPRCSVIQDRGAPF